MWLGGKQKQAVLVGLGKASDAGVDAKWGQSVYQVFGSGVAAAAKAAKAKTVALTFAADPKHDLVRRLGLQWGRNPSCLQRGCRKRALLGVGGEDGGGVGCRHAPGVLGEGGRRPQT